MKWLEQIKSARMKSVPIIAVNTADPQATMCAISGTLDPEHPQLEWDVIRGLSGRNEPGRQEAALHTDGDYGDPTINNPTELLIVAAKFRDRSIVFVHLAHRWCSEAAYVQALWNLRDKFKATGRTLILLGKQHVIPCELVDDIVLIEEPLPDSLQLQAIIQQLCKDASLDAPEESITRASEAVTGLSAFAAEQVTAMCLRRSGIDLASLWEHKRKQIEQTPGLRVFRDGGAFRDIGGCETVKGFLSQIMHGKRRPNAIVFIDEIEKMIGGTGDTSGVSQDQLGSILSYMQDHNAAGMIFIGPPGAAKSAVAKAAGTEGGVPTIQLDLGAAKGSLVGQSEQQLRSALKVISAVSNDQSLWIATCNSIGELPPELRRRFTLGTFFFDLPTEKERLAIWQIYRREMHREDALPHDAGWTGAEIRQCCDIADRLGCTLREAAAFVVPVSVSAAGIIRRLQEQANARFLSASYPGLYRMTTNGDSNSQTTSRPMQLTE